MDDPFSTHHWHMPRALVFLTVVKEGSFSAAARSLKLSKSVVSSHVRQLEEMCGARLLERTSRKLRLTEAGEIFLPHVQQMHDAWKLGLDKLKATQEEPSGKLRVTAPTFMGQLLIIPTVNQLMELFPKLSVELHLNDQMIDLMADNIDVALRAGPLVDSSLIARKIGTDREIIVATPTLANQMAHCKRPEQLIDMPWVVHAIFPHKRAFFGPKDECVRIPINAKASATTSEGLLGLTTGGIGLAMMPKLLAMKDLQDGTLQRVLPSWRGRITELFAVYPSRDFVPPKVTAFIHQLQQIYNTLPIPEPTSTT